MKKLLLLLLTVTLFSCSKPEDEVPIFGGFVASTATYKRCYINGIMKDFSTLYELKHGDKMRIYMTGKNIIGIITVGPKQVYQTLTTNNGCDKTYIVP